MEDTAQTRYDAATAAAYDGRAPVTIPGYDVMHRLACSILRQALPGSARLLVIGAGTGKELRTLGESNGEWSFTGVDPSGEMLAVAREALAGNGMAERVQFFQGVVQDLPESPGFDGATALLVMHFMPDDGTKADFLRAIARRLRPGAPLVLVSQYGQRPSRAFDEAIAAWKHYQLSLGMTQEKVEEGMARRLRNNTYVPEARIQALLEEAGFDNVERFFQAFVVGGWSARRAAR
ncbi:MAG: class I SAM-dependent methyltransferase [SAR324 cluster bacterium]|nr:class I SAM-dependent methyltransferase [SAR324 cluster bacterium]MCZ6844104.1 class I SAM-dependent methyltransferase [SAR324 cluster bacterium]